jgi:hypothetical protein
MVLGMNKRTKSLIYTICKSVIFLVILYFAVYYFFGIHLRGRYHAYEGFQGGIGWGAPPFISGSVFKDLCDYNLDDRYALVPIDEDIQRGDKVFMKVNDIPAFLANPPPVLVTVVISNSDEEFDDTLMRQIKPYVTSVYAIGCSAAGAKQIPIGFRDDQYTPHKDLVDILTNTELSGEKTTLCLVNFLLETNGGERQRALDRFSSEKWATVDKSYLNYGLSKATVFTIPETIQKRLDYYAMLKKTKFVVCPPGRGKDTHRVYETLFFGGIPIIKRSFLDPMYEKLGGCWIVNDWTDVTEEECNKRWAAKGQPMIQYDATYWLK